MIVDALRDQKLVEFDVTGTETGSGTAEIEVPHADEAFDVGFALPTFLEFLRFKEIANLGQIMIKVF
jgi:hypothetical protein